MIMRASSVRLLSADRGRAAVWVVLLAGVLGLTSLAGCTQAVEVPPPRAFNRPARIAFVCFDAANVPTAIGACVDAAGAFVPGFRLIALVPQQTRGEVGAVELSSAPPRVLDSDQRVPGYTFVETGEVPAAIAVSETSANCTWVANRGSRDIWGIETVRFIDESLSTSGGAVSRLALDELEVAPGTTASGRPQEMLLHESGTTSELFVTLPEDGLIARIPVSDEGGCTFGTPVLIPVPGTLPAAPADPGTISEPTLAPLAEQTAATLAVCPPTPATLELVAPVPRFVEVEPLPADLPAPLPLEMVFERDPATNVPLHILVGDAALPVIYRFDLALGAFEESLRTDGPIRDLTITAPVPDDVAGSEFRRYVYAIDERDGSVMVIDASTSTGFVIPVQPLASGRPLRLPFRSPARAIEAIDTLRMGGEPCSDDTEVAARADRLRGVFVAVALSDGTVRIVDVHDEDAVCRGRADCENRFTGSEELAFIRRHRPRIGVRIVDPIGLTDVPSAVSSGATVRFDQTGGVDGEPLIPAFVPMAACPEGLAPVFQSGAAANFLCAITDPWSALPETFAVTWQGRIPDTASAAGTFEDRGGGLLALDARTDLCARGVLPGDLLAITPPAQPDPLPEGVSSERCRALAATETSAAGEPFLVPTRDVSAGESSAAVSPFESRIVVAADAPVLNRQPLEPALTIRDILDCYGDPQIEYELRVGTVSASPDGSASGAFAVVGSNSGFLHRVVADDAAGGSCAVDESLDPLLQGRAEIGAPFVSRRLAFTLTGAMPASPIEIRFQIANTPAQLSVDLGVVDGGRRELTLPTELVWSQPTSTLYALDELRRGLAVIAVDGLRATRFIE